MTLMAALCCTLTACATSTRPVPALPTLPPASAFVPCLPPLVYAGQTAKQVLADAASEIVRCDIVRQEMLSAWPE